MKTKIVLISFLSVLLFSCSKDDDNSDPEAKIPADEKLLETVKLGSTDAMNLTYNPDKTVKELTFYNGLVYFDYDQGNIHSITTIGEGYSKKHIFQYQNGKISSFSVDDIVTPVTYNATENYYLYQNEFQEEFTFELNEDDEIKSILIYDNITNEVKSRGYYIFDTTKSGGMTNSNSINVHLSIVLGQSWELYGIPFFKKAVKTIYTINGSINSQNTFDNQGFIKSAIFSTGEENITFKYSYTQLEN